MNKKGMLLTLILVISAILSGCMRVDAGATVQPDGGGTVGYSLVVHPEVLKAAQAQNMDLLGDYAKDMQEKGYDTRIEETADGPMLTVQQTGSDVGEMLATLGFAYHPGQRILQVQKGLFRTTYVVRTMVNPQQMMAPLLAQGEPEIQTMADQALAKGRYTFTLQLPEVATSHDAQSVANGGRELHWDLTYNKDNTISAIAETPVNKGKVVGVLLGAAILALTIIWALFRIRKPKAADEYSDYY